MQTTKEEPPFMFHVMGIQVAELTRFSTTSDIHAKIDLEEYQPSDILLGLVVVCPLNARLFDGVGLT